MTAFKVSGEQRAVIAERLRRGILDLVATGDYQQIADLKGFEFKEMMALTKDGTRQALHLLNRKSGEVFVFDLSIFVMMFGHGYLPADDEGGTS